MYSHYVIVLDWATEDDEAIAILGVTHTYEDAKEIFDKQLVEEKQYVEERGYDVNHEDATTFDAGKMGCWRDNHTTLYIQGVN